MDTNRNRRKVYLIDRKIQFSFLRSIVIAILVVSLFFGFFLVVINDYLTETLVSYAEHRIDIKPQLPQDADLYRADELRNLLKQRDILFTIKIILAAIFMSILVGFYAIRFSHRIAGPVYRIKKSLEQAVTGDYSVRIVLRKRDFLKDVAADFNALMDSLQKKGPQR